MTMEKFSINLVPGKSPELPDRLVRIGECGVNALDLSPDYKKWQWKCSFDQFNSFFGHSGTMIQSKLVLFGGLLEDKV